MAIFNRSVKKAAISPEPSKAAAAGGGGGAQSVGRYYQYVEGTARNNAMSVPTISRARDLMASVIGCQNLRMYNEIWNGNELEKVYIAPRSWLRRISPSVTNNFLLSWLFDDLFFYGAAYLYITSRTADGYPASFDRLPFANVTRRDQPGPVFFGPSNELYFAGEKLDSTNVVQFLSPIQGIVYQSTQAVATALKLEAARYRNSSSQIASGILQQTGGEPLSGQELAGLAQSFAAARDSNQIAALNEFVKFQETTSSPDKMLLIDSAQFQAADLCRLTNIPSYLAGISVGGYSYVSNQGARLDLWTFGAKPYAECIASTLSMNNVLPNGTYVEFDSESYLSAEYTMQDDMPQIDETVNIGLPS
jgi:hypothetical protein